MILSSGARLLHYEILSALGAGGMGEVYRALDHKLHREVALKLLPSGFAADAGRLARFEREARVLASLNHPNIAAIYAVEHTDSGPFLVLELVEGQTIQERLAARRMDVTESLRLLTQVASALDAAHERGIVHRDVKPANIKITNEGVAKVLDFGIAKAADPQMPIADAPTGTDGATELGTVVGTVAYMSPEQAQGKELDKRTDVWSFGVLMFEMFAHKKAFDGPTSAQVMAKILEQEPDWSLLPPLPSGVQDVLMRCLQKEPADRLRDIGDIRVLVQHAISKPVTQAHATHSKPKKPSRTVIGLAAGAAVLLVIAAILWRRSPVAEPAPTIRLEIAQPSGQLAPSTVAVSPDGRKVAFTASDGKANHVWVRSLEALDARPLDGTDGAGMLFWSEDSQFIGFAAQGKLQKIPAAGGPVTVITDVPNGFTGGFWTGDGGILFTSFRGNGGVFRIASSGGSPVSVKLNGMPANSAPTFPVPLPDGRHFLFCDCVSNGSGIYVASIDGKEQVRRIVDARSRIAYSPSSNGKPGYVLFLQGSSPQGAVFAELGGTLMAQPLQDDGFTAPGEAVAVAEQVSSYSFSVSKTGVLVYGTGNTAVSSDAPGATYGQMTWFDRQGHVTGKLGDLATYRIAEISPDGKRAAVEMVDPKSKNMDVWLFEFAHGANTRFTFHPEADFSPVWSADSTRLLYTTYGLGKGAVWYERASDMASDEKPIFMLKEGAAPSSWSPDGRWVLYNDFSVLSDILALDTQSRERTSTPIVKSPGNDIMARFSPDGKWIAYASTEAGMYEVFVKPFTPPSEPGFTAEGRKWMISKGSGPGGAYWRGDGKELFYISSDNILMSTEVTTTPNFSSKPRVPLFKVPSSILFFGVMPDGNHFLMPVPPSSNAPPSFKVVLNWTSALKK